MSGNTTQSKWYSQENGEAIRGRSRKVAIALSSVFLMAIGIAIAGITLGHMVNTSYQDTQEIYNPPEPKIYYDSIKNEFFSIPGDSTKVRTND